MAGLKGLSAADRKKRPVYSGVLKYFPDAIAEVAYVSYVGNEQHNPGQPLHWAKEKSADEPDAEVRHMIDGITEVFDVDGVRHRAKKAWRALADLQREIDAENAGPKKMRVKSAEIGALGAVGYIGVIVADNTQITNGLNYGIKIRIGTQVWGLGNKAELEPGS